MRRKLALACAVLVSSTVLGAVPAPRASAVPDDGEAALQADADGPLRIRREGGVATFVGTPAGTDIDNPGVGRGTSVSAAARAHLNRYGDAIGADRVGTRLVEQGRSSAAAGGAVVRYQQEVDGLPVLGGDVVVTLDKGRDLASMDANLSDAASVSTVTVSEDDARATALGAVGRTRVKGATAEDFGRWVIDPETIPVAGLSQTRSAWRFEVRAGDDVRRMVLIDDRSGAVLLDVDLIHSVDRTVCDQQNVRVVNPGPCVAGAARTEGAPASAVTDVNAAYDNAGRTSELYAELANGAMQDLTALVGVATPSGKKLAATVRVCLDSGSCPYANAYWNGEAMFYGQGYAVADDVVGHEITHGVIERTSGLIYYDQSGAINESLADIIGEIVDHRRTTVGEDPGQFLLGEDLPIGALRSAADPTAMGDPDRVGSPNWYAAQYDSGGVHYNSGVGNKAFHLISQGGTFNGQTVVGIDASNPDATAAAELTKSARLWLQVIATVPAFAEYDDLAVVLEQACSTLVDGGSLSPADCTAVHQAVVATEMTQRPGAEPIRDVDRSCPEGTSRRVLLDSESGASPGSTFTAAAGGWRRLPSDALPDQYENSYSEGTAWFGEDAETGAGGGLAAKALRASSFVQVPPATQPTYLAFRHWHVFEYEETSPISYWDGGTLEAATSTGSVVSLAGEDWTNGTQRVLQPESGAHAAFAGSSKGWYGSQVALTAFGGQRIKPQFTIRYDELYGAPGWYLDDIEVYTCDPLGLEPLTSATVSTVPRVGKVVAATGATWSHVDATSSYQWRRNGAAIAGATRSTYTPVAGDLGKNLSVQVTGVLGVQSATPYVLSAGTVRAGVITAPRTVTAGGTPYVGRRLTALRGTWSPSGITFRYQWLRDGRVISGATRSTFVIRRIDKRHRISVRITGSKPGYTTVVRTSARRLVTR